MNERWLADVKNQVDQSTRSWGGAAGELVLPSSDLR